MPFALTPEGPTPSVPVNALVGAAPVALGNLAMGGAAGAEVPIIAGGLNVVIEYAKNRKWFREAAWTVPLLVVLSFAVAFGVWHFLADDNLKAAVNGFGILAQSHLNYTGAKATGLGILGPVPDENKWGSG